MQRILITGATGFLGFALTRYLVQCGGFEIFALGRNQRRGEEIRKLGAQFIAVDINEIKDEDAFKNIDAVVHCAARSASWGKWKDFYEDNVLGTKSIISLCEKFRIPKLVHISSPSIFADLRDCFDLKEEDPLPQSFMNDYAHTKHLAEQCVQSSSIDNKIILRPQAIIGEGDQTIFPRFIEVNEKGGIPIFGGRNPVLDVTDVTNVVHAIHLALKKEDIRRCEVYHITNDQPMHLHDILKRVFNGIHTELKARSIPYQLAKYLAVATELGAKFLNTGEPLLTRYSLSLLAHSRTLNITKAKEELEYQPVITLHDAIDNYIRSLRS